MRLSTISEVVLVIGITVVSIFAQNVGDVVQVKKNNPEIYKVIEVAGKNVKVVAENGVISSIQKNDVKKASAADQQIYAVRFANAERERNKQKSVATQTQKTPTEEVAQTRQTPAVSAQTNWTGDGGKGKSIAIVAPQATGLIDGLEYLPELVQGELVSNFATFSAISVLDRQSLDKVYTELMSGVYADDATAVTDLGHLVPSQYILSGKITRTASGYALQLQITRTAKDDKTTVVSYSGTCTFHELDNLTGVRRASKELLKNMGVALTEQAQTALVGAAASSHVSAQTALAQGIVAQRQGTEVAALSYYFQAAAFDPKLAEAASRSSVVAANVSGANIGQNIRNDIVWQREWVARLKETEEALYKIISSADLPYQLHYFANIKTGNINYQAGTADLSFAIKLSANIAWFNGMWKVYTTVRDGLDATNRKKEWGLEDWPRKGLSQTNPFYKQWKNDIAVEFELVDQHGQVIGKQTARMAPSFILENHRPKHTGIVAQTVTFNDVKADDISDNLVIRPVLINGKPPETARFSITNGIIGWRRSR